MNTTLTIKMDKKLRNDLKKTADRLGVPVTTAVNAMVKQFVRDRRLVLEEACPFPSHTPNTETKRAMRELRTRKDVEIFKTFEGFQEHVRSL